ncbi:helix-turn-helix transcriptional regulator [Kocuria oceani]|nr:helix-turn-helix transcriptional regulator [Kocuria oceani]
MELHDRKKLAKLIVIQDVSQRELAQLAGWKTHSYLGSLLRGDAKTLNPEPALRIAKALGCGVDDLFLTKVSVDARQIDGQSKTARKKVAA